MAEDRRRRALARVVAHGPHFFAALRRCGIQGGSEESKAVVSTLRTLAEGNLPGAGDHETTRPPLPDRYWVRQVRGLSLFLMFRFDDRKLLACSVVRARPPRYEGPARRKLGLPP